MATIAKITNIFKDIITVCREIFKRAEKKSRKNPLTGKPYLWYNMCQTSPKRRVRHYKRRHYK